MGVLFAYPGDLDTPTGGYRYDREIISRISLPVTTLSLGAGFPEPSEEQRAEALKLLEEADPHDVAVVDGLAGGAFPKGLELLASKGSAVVALIHHPLCLESGIGESLAYRLEESERKGLEHASHVITTSASTRESVAGLFGFPLDKITAIVPGVDRGEISSPWESGPVELLCVASITPRKAHLDLIAALEPLRDLDWRLTCVGPHTLDSTHAGVVWQAVKNAGLETRVRFAGSIPASALDAAYGSAHAFVLASHYEGYGMVFSEAITRGLPVVATLGGAIPKTVPKGCGILVEPGDLEAFSAALREMIANHERRNAMRDKCLAVANTFPTWEDTANEFCRTLERMR